MTKPKTVNYSAGNAVHWIQAKKAFQDRDSWRPAQVVDIGDGELSLAVGEDPARFLCADSPRLARILNGASRVRLSERWSLLSVSNGPDNGVLPGVTRLEDGQSVEVVSPGGGGRHLFSVKRLA